MKAKALSIMRYQDDINTEHNMKSILVCAAVAQWTKRLTRNGYMRVKNWKGANISFITNLNINFEFRHEKMSCTMLKKLSNCNSSDKI